MNYANIKYYSKFTLGFIGIATNECFSNALPENLKHKVEA